MTLRDQGRLPPLTGDALLVGTPGGNTGDVLLQAGGAQYLADRGIDAWASDGSIEEAALAEDDEYLGDLFASFRGLLIFAGGGNIGIYPNNALVRARTIARLGSRQRCLVLPQSALAAEAALVDPRVTVWCRDAASLRLLRHAGAKVELVPDTACYLDRGFARAPGGSGTFFIKRAPGRDREYVDHAVPEGVASEDLTFETPLQAVIDRLRPFEFVLSDRLHGGLIALMMRKKIALLTGTYWKTRAFFQTWLAPLGCAAFAASSGEALAMLPALTDGAFDLTEIFCRAADPALNAFLAG